MWGGRKGVEHAAQAISLAREMTSVCGLPNMRVRLKLSQLDGRQTQPIIIHPQLVTHHMLESPVFLKI